MQNMAAPTPLSSNADLDGTNANPASTSRDVLPLSEKTDQLAQARVTVPRDARLAVMPTDARPPSDARETATRVHCGLDRRVVELRSKFCQVVKCRG